MDNKSVVPATSNTIGRLAGPSADSVVCFNQGGIPVDKRLTVAIVNADALRALEEKCKTLERVAAAISLLHNVVTEAKTMLDKQATTGLLEPIEVELSLAALDKMLVEADYWVPMTTQQQVINLVHTVVHRWLATVTAVKITITP